MSPTNVDQWWELFEQNKSALRDLVIEYCPTVYQKNKASLESQPMPITAPNAEAACEVVRKELAVDYDPATVFNKLVEHKDGLGLVSLLNKTWFGVPESTGCWALDGFGALCDLCSESWVFSETD